MKMRDVIVHWRFEADQTNREIALEAWQAALRPGAEPFVQSITVDGETFTSKDFVG